MQSDDSTKTWAFACHLDFGGTGAVRVVRKGPDGIRVTAIPTDDAQKEAHPPVFLGTTADDRVILMAAGDKSISVREAYPAHAAAPYAYRNAQTGHLWFTIDGDKETGCDTLNCGDSGSPVMVVNPGTSADAPGELLRLVCVGRGHHVPTFTAPSEAFPDIPRCAFVSNLLDGTISVLGHDPDRPDTYLRVIDTINLCEPAREKEGIDGTPNNAFPHGKVFSPLTGRLYSLNNGYGTIAVINPVNREIEQRIELKVSSNLLLSPDGRYIIGKGADRKSDPAHVMGRLSVVDAVTGSVETTLDLPDIYPSTYRFSPDGRRLYVTTAATGKGAQRENLRIDLLLVYDATALPELRLLREVLVGAADCGRRPIGFVTSKGAGDTAVIVPNPTDGTLSLLDAEDLLMETVPLCERAVKEFNFSFWNGVVSGS